MTETKKCSYQGCNEIATAELKEEESIATPYCTAHAQQRQQEIISGESKKTGQAPFDRP